MLKTSADLDAEILQIISKGYDHCLSDDVFNQLALDIFNYQYTHNLYYQKYCELLGRRSSDISIWQDIPAIPTDAFKEDCLSCFPTENTVKVFHTSGTTQQLSGKHYLDTLVLYEASLEGNFKQHLFPDLERIKILSLTPSPIESPHSSLVFMIDKIMRKYGTDGSGYFLNNNQLDIQNFLKACISDEPLLVVGTAFSFVHLIDFCTESNISCFLPSQSRIMETGGFKGRSREVGKADLYQSMSVLFDISPERIINEYGMTELGTQFYDNSLIKRHDISYKDIPCWARIVIWDPEHQTPITLENQPGLIRIYDLSNRGSVIAIQTQDIGYKVSNGFEVIGRMGKSVPRGCSLDTDDRLS